MGNKAKMTSLAYRDAFPLLNFFARNSFEKWEIELR
jgi:hypothetical protein